MSEDGSVDVAAVAAFLESGGDVTPEAEPYVDDVAPDPSEVPQQETEQPEPEPLFREIPEETLADLDPAQRAYLEKRVNDWRADYTRKTTANADAQRILEAAGGDPQAVLDAYEFAQALENDADTRARLYQALKAQMEPAAPTPEPATPEATDPFSEYDLPPEIASVLREAATANQRLAAIEARAVQAEQQQARQEYLQEVFNDLNTQWDKVVEAYPDLQGENAQEAKEIEEEIFAYAAHTEGNIAMAHDLWRRAEARAQARLFEGSANVPGGTTMPPRGAGHSTEPPEPITDMKQAGIAAREFLEQHMQ